MILLLCWCAYASIYLGRNNLSVAIPEIQNYLGADMSRIGIIGGLFLWVYGIGQLVNGYAGDRISSRVFIFTGLFVAALANILFGFAGSLSVMCILWAVNGFFQSMLWGPITKTITHWIPPEKRSFAAIAVSTSGVGGTLAAFIFAGQVLDKLTWKWVFWIPGTVILIFSFVWYSMMRDNPDAAGFDITYAENVCTEESCVNIQENYSLWEVIKKTKLWVVIFACMAQGIVKDGINLWAPAFFIEMHKLDIKMTAGFITVIPLLSFGGMILAGWLNKMLKYREEVAAAILFAAGTVMIIGLNILGRTSAFAGAVFLGLSSAMMNGANTILLGIIPMKYAKYGKVSAIAGALDFSSYFVSGFAAAVTGFIVKLSGWEGVMGFWIIATVCGTISLAYSRIKKGRVPAAAQKAAQSELNS